VVFAPAQLRSGSAWSSRWPPASGLPCAILIDATIDAQSPGDLIDLRWWVEARVRYFDRATIPPGAAVDVTVVTSAEDTAHTLELCADNEILVLGEAHQRGLLSDAEFLAQIDQIQAGTWDPAPLRKLDEYQELCVAAIASLRSAEAPPSPPPSEADPFAPRAEASLPEETVALGLDSLIYVRDVRLTRNAAAADPAGESDRLSAHRHLGSGRRPTCLSQRLHSDLENRRPRADRGRYDITASPLPVRRSR
jgi:hypothetical protein